MGNLKTPDLRQFKKTQNLEILFIGLEIQSLDNRTEQLIPKILKSDLGICNSRCRRLHVAKMNLVV